MKHNERTKWEGLWKQREGIYSGKTIKKSDIPAYARLIVRHNKFYEADSSRPRFVYLFASGDAADAITIEKTNDEYITLTDAKEILEKVERLADVMRRGQANGNVMRLASESQAIASDLYEEAIEIIEDITGEEWDFSYLTY